MQKILILLFLLFSISLFGQNTNEGVIEFGLLEIENVPPELRKSNPHDTLKNDMINRYLANNLKRTFYFIDNQFVVEWVESNAKIRTITKVKDSIILTQSFIDDENSKYYIKDSTKIGLIDERVDKFLENVKVINIPGDITYLGYKSSLQKLVFNDSQINDTVIFITSNQVITPLLKYFKNEMVSALFPNNSAQILITKIYFESIPIYYGIKRISFEKVNPALFNTDTTGYQLISDEAGKKMTEDSGEKYIENSKIEGKGVNLKLFKEVFKKGGVSTETFEYDIENNCSFDTFNIIKSFCQSYFLETSEDNNLILKLIDKLKEIEIVPQKLIINLEDAYKQGKLVDESNFLIELDLFYYKNFFTMPHIKQNFVKNMKKTGVKLKDGTELDKNLSWLNNVQDFSEFLQNFEGINEFYSTKFNSDSDKIIQNLNTNFKEAFKNIKVPPISCSMSDKKILIKIGNNVYPIYIEQLKQNSLKDTSNKTLYSKLVLNKFLNICKQINVDFDLNLSFLEIDLLNNLEHIENINENITIKHTNLYSVIDVNRLDSIYPDYFLPYELESIENDPKKCEGIFLSQIYGQSLQPQVKTQQKNLIFNYINSNKKSFGFDEKAINDWKELLDQNLYESNIEVLNGLKTFYYSEENEDYSLMNTSSNSKDFKQSFKIFNKFLLGTLKPDKFEITKSAENDVVTIKMTLGKTKIEISEPLYDCHLILCSKINKYFEESKITEKRIYFVTSNDFRNNGCLFLTPDEKIEIEKILKEQFYLL